MTFVSLFRELFAACSV